MLPGIPKEIKDVNIDDRQIGRIEAIILSMTPAERNDPALLNASRRKRIADGSGVDVQQVNALVKQFDEMRKMMKQVMRGGGMPDLGALGAEPGMGAGGLGMGGSGGTGMAGLGAGAGVPTHGGTKANRKKKKKR